MKRTQWYKVTITDDEGSRTHTSFTDYGTKDELMAELIDSYDPFINTLIRKD